MLIKWDKKPVSDRKAEDARKNGLGKVMNMREGGNTGAIKERIVISFLKAGRTSFFNMERDKIGDLRNHNM